MSNAVNISLISYKGKQNSTLKDILSSINGYLIRNKGAVSDFNLVKDIVDRNIDKEEDEISNNLPIPLYLGLIGTMLGIIIGLMYMPSVSNIGTEVAGEADRTMQGVDTLLSGVKIAMIASVIGLILTTISSFLFFRIRRKVENQKHDFFTFIQTRLLPILSQNTSSSIYSLQSNLLQFNRDFTSNMQGFNGIITTVKDAFDSQLEVVKELKRIDVANIAKYNIDVMQQLKSSFEKLKDLSIYLEGMNGFLGNTRELNYAVTQQLQKVGEISEIIGRFDANADTISENSTYLKSHFRNFEKREQDISNKIADFDKNTSKMIDNLEDSFTKRLQNFNDKDVEISSGFEKLFEDLRQKTREVFEDEGGNITAIKRDIDKLKGVSSELSNLNQKVAQQDGTIRELLDILRDKPLQVGQSKLVNIGTIVLAVVGSITCGLIIYKLLVI